MPTAQEIETEESPRKKLAGTIATLLSPNQSTATKSKKRTQFQYEEGEVLTEADSIARFRLQEQAREAKKAATTTKKATPKKRGRPKKKATSAPAKKTKKGDNTPTTRSGDKAFSKRSLFQVKKGREKELGALAPQVGEVEVSSTDNDSSRDTSVDSDEVRSYEASMKYADDSDVDIDLKEICKNPMASSSDASSSPASSRSPSPSPGPSKLVQGRTKSGKFATTKSRKFAAQGTSSGQRGRPKKSSLPPAGRSPTPTPLRSSEEEDDPQPYAELKNNPFKVITKPGDIIVVHNAKVAGIPYLPAIVHLQREDHVDVRMLSFNYEEELWEVHAKTLQSYRKNQIVNCNVEFEMASTTGYHIPLMTTWNWPPSRVREAEPDPEPAPQPDVDAWRDHLHPGQFVIIDWLSAKYPGMIVDELPDKKFTITCYHQKGNGWSLPSIEDSETYECSDIVCAISPPKKINVGARSYVGVWEFPEMAQYMDKTK